jgi:hypothetical protein
LQYGATSSDGLEAASLSSSSSKSLIADSGNKYAMFANKMTESKPLVRVMKQSGLIKERAGVHVESNTGAVFSTGEMFKQPVGLHYRENAMQKRQSQVRAVDASSSMR